MSNKLITQNPFFKSCHDIRQRVKNLISPESIRIVCKYNWLKVQPSNELFVIIHGSNDFTNRVEHYQNKIYPELDPFLEICQLPSTKVPGL